MKQKPNTTIVPPTAFAKQDTSPASERTEPQEQPLTVAAPSPKKTLPSQKKKTTDAASVAPMQKDKASDTTPKKPSRTTKKRASKPTDNDEQLSAMDLVRQRCGLSEDDVAMIFELGYENELGRLVGYDNLRQLKTSICAARVLASISTTAPPLDTAVRNMPAQASAMPLPRHICMTASP